MAPSNEMLWAVVRLLLKRSNEAHARAEAMRLALQHRDVFSWSEYQKFYDQLIAATIQRTEQLIARLESSTHDEEIRQLLQDFEGPVQ
jgi:hypothetical protein